MEPAPGSWLIPRGLEPLGGNELIPHAGANVRDFWSWAYSDLRSNTDRGIFAEFLVARALGDRSPLRKSWANHDVTTPTGVRVEVKSSGYLQSWRQRKLSRIGFGRLIGLTWDDQTLEWGEAPEVRADVYVFAIQTCVDPGAYDVLDVDQWQFRVLPASVVEANPVKSVGIGFLDRHAPRKLRLTELAEAVEEASFPTLGR